MKNSSTSEQDIRTTVRGMVLPAQWNAHFEVTGILVACRDERELRVENLECFPALLTLSQQEAVFTGLVKEKDGVESILLESFTPVLKVEE